MSTRAVIVCGGEGTQYGVPRAILPKPLLPVGNRAILDIVVRQLRAAGFTDLSATVGMLAPLIQVLFADGTHHGVRLRYHMEEEPLGTVGALSAIPDLDEPFLLVNGNILTTLDLRAFFDVHARSHNALTIATHQREVVADFGVIEAHDFGAATSVVSAYHEKPARPHAVSMGIFAVDPHVLQYIPRGQRLDFPELVVKLLAAGEQVGAYRFEGPWFDLGRRDDYDCAQSEFEGLRPELPLDDAAEQQSVPRPASAASKRD
jgi:NDP-sugar pyrophosphorylase family protein